MTAPSLAYQLDSHRPVASPRVEFSPGVREQIREAAIAAQATSSGIPLAGVLLGQYTDSVLQVTGWISLGAFPGYETLEIALKVEAARQERRGLVCLGWFRSRNSGDCRASGEDVQLFSRVFPHAWQMTLFVRPAYQRPAQASLYLRDAHGLVRADRPVESFFLFPPDPQVGTHPLVTALAAFLGKRYSPWLALGMLVAGVMTGGLWAVQNVRANGPAPLAIQEAYGGWQISWERTLGWQPGTRASLELREGNAIRTIDLNQMELRKGSTRLAKLGRSVEPIVYLRVAHPDGRKHEERTRLVAEAQPRATKPARHR